MSHTIFAPVKKMFACLVLLCTFAMAVPGISAKEESLAVVNVSLVFENYKSVAETQRMIDEIFKQEKLELQQSFEILAKKTRELGQFNMDVNSTESGFDAVQKLRKEQFVYERNLNRMNGEIQKRYTQQMRSILSDIRGAIRAVAETGKFAMVLRSPDTDDPEVLETKIAQNPSAGDNNTLLALHEPKSVSEILERFNRNPVLAGLKTVDITQDVLKLLNDEYGKHSGSGIGPKR